MDNVEEIRRKQQPCVNEVETQSFLKYDVRVSYLEGIMARGDIRVADVVEKPGETGADSMVGTKACDTIHGLTP